MVSPTGSLLPAPTLWDKAFGSLDVALRDKLTANKIRERDILGAVLQLVSKQREESRSKQWQFKKPNGDTIIVRHVLGKIALWIKSIQSVGDVAVSFDPVHAALPWAAFRFLLQAAVSDIEVSGTLLSDLESIAHIISRYREFEGLHIQGAKSETELMLEKTLIRLYGEILTYLARAVRIFQERSTTRLLKSPFRMPSPEQMRKIQAHDSEAMKLAHLSETGTILLIKNLIDKQSQDFVSFTTEMRFEEKYNAILTWLSPLPYCNHHHFVSDSRPPNAGEWLLVHDEYVDWQMSSSSALFLLHGITGSGKSTLCSLVVNSWLANSTISLSADSLAYFYCENSDFNNTKLSSDDVMRTIVSQLAFDQTKPKELRGCLVSEYESQTSRVTRASKLDIPKLRTQDCVRLMLELAQQLELFILIDGIDSIEKHEQHLLITGLEEVRSKAKNVVKIFVASRTHDWTLTAISPARQIRITTDETKTDMVAFVNRTVDNAIANKLLLAGNVLRHHHIFIVQTLIDGAGEMFIWVKLQVERLCRENHVEDVLKKLQGGLPETLEELYQQTLDYILQKGERSCEIAVRAFSWILYTKETLVSTALMAALSATDGATTLSLAQVIADCANLIVLDTKRDIICFMHQSVRGFLVQQEQFAPTSANRLISSACIKIATRGLASEETLGSAHNDFAVYAAMYWPVHTKLAEDTNGSNPIMDKVKAFMFDEDFDTTLSFTSWLSNIRRIGLGLARNHIMKPPLNAIPIGDDGFLFLLSIFGLNDLLSLVLSRKGDLNLNDINDLGNTPIYLAAALGHARAVSMLANSGASIDTVCGRHGSALHAACFEGHLEVVETLLKLQANIACGGVYRDALQAAFQGDQEDVALLLIDHVGMVTSEDDYERALEGAARSGFRDIVTSLQAPRFAPLRKSLSEPDKVKKKIREAIEGGQLNIIRQFIGTQTHFKDALPSDSVSLATQYKHENMVEFLLNKGASVEAESTFGTPLRTAALFNSESLIRLLLKRGAQVNAHGQFGVALQAAAMKGHTSVMKLLIDEGANVNQRTEVYGTALQAAAYHGHEDAVEILLDAGADIYAPGYSMDAFHAAAAGGHQNIIEMIRQKDHRVRPSSPVPAAELSSVEPPLFEVIHVARWKRAIYKLETIFKRARG
ncbi:ankyrin 1 [Apiospora arundinis]|uniref:Ankyrin 1 n=1 Tax=Apiospora arundinis TaxID=335852 RepID=A0ABR2JGY5_9PEZI